MGGVLTGNYWRSHRAWMAQHSRFDQKDDRFVIKYQLYSIISALLDFYFQKDKFSLRYFFYLTESAYNVTCLCRNAWTFWHKQAYCICSVISTHFGIIIFWESCLISWSSKNDHITTSSCNQQQQAATTSAFHKQQTDYGGLRIQSMITQIL